MHARRQLITLVLFVCIALTATAAAPFVLTADERICDAVGQSRKPADLLAFLKTRATGAETLKHADKLIEQLGDEEYATRQQAIRELEQIGPAVLPLLGKHTKHQDFEVRKNVARVMARLEPRAEAERKLETPLSQSVVRVLAMSRVVGVAEALLEYLPSADCTETHDEIYYAIDELHARGEASKALLEALADKSAWRRALAGCVLAKSDDAKERAAAKRLLGDYSPMVQLRVAQGLLASWTPDVDALPVLIRLLREESREIGWQAEELLRFAGGRWLPDEVLGAHTKEERERCYKAWRVWWQDWRNDLRLNDLHYRGRRPGLMVGYQQAGEKDADQSDHVTLWGCEGGPRYTLKLDRPVTLQDVAWRPTGDMTTIVLGGLVVRRGLDGKVQWRRSVHGEHRGKMQLQLFADGRYTVKSESAFNEYQSDGKQLRYIESGLAPSSLPSYGAPPMTKHNVTPIERLPNGDKLAMLDRPVEISTNCRVVWHALSTSTRKFHKIAVVHPLLRFGFRRPENAVTVDIQSMDGFLQAMEDRRVEWRRWGICQLYSESDDSRALNAITIQGVIHRLRDSDESVRRVAHEILVKLVKTPGGIPDAAIPNLVGLMTGNKRHRDLLSYTSTNAVPPLLDVVASSSGPSPAAIRVRTDALKYLTSHAIRHGDERARKAVTVGLRDSERDVVLWVMRGIAWNSLRGDALFFRQFAKEGRRHVCPNAAAFVSDLIPIAKSKDTLIAKEALATISSIGDSAGEAVPLLFELLNDANRRADALNCLGCVGGKNANVLPILRKYIERDEDPFVSFVAVGALARYGPKQEVVEGLIKALDDSREINQYPSLNPKPVRRQAVTWLGTFGSQAKRATTRLLMIAKDKKEETILRLAALAALEVCHDRPVVLEFETIKKDDTENREVQQYVLAALERMRGDAKTRSASVLKSPKD